MSSDPEPEEKSAALFVDDAVRAAQAAVEWRYLFRKIGLPFDYASDPDDFPSKAFATAREARSNLPNPSGLGGGYHFSCRNHALLFDAYLLRIELGIETAGDEAILDRLIGGLIRLATIAPKSFLVSGLAPDGRGFYGAPRRENHAAWSFAVARGLVTAAIAPESQEKFRSIVGKWINRVRRERFRLHGVDGKAVSGGDFSLPEAADGPLYLAMHLVAAKASQEDRDFEQYVQAVLENDGARLAPYTPDGGWQNRLPELLWRQASLALLAANDYDEARVVRYRALLVDNAKAAIPFVDVWRKWDASLADEPVDLNWRTFPKAPLEETPYGFTPPESWRRIDNDRFLEDALSASYAALFAADADLVRDAADSMQECLTTIPWEKCLTLTAVAPAIGVHARGVELGLWDTTLFESRRTTPSSETSFAAKYLEPDYDEFHPDKAGHRTAPPGKKKPPPEQAAAKSDGTKRRRKRRRPKA
ncbi:MAG: hypothetical protein LIQ30_03160 [Planctomycetes bacterium]|nr:hypothetical protein [Planctomycetota bacterium]